MTLRLHKISLFFIQSLLISQSAIAIEGGHDSLDEELRFLQAESFVITASKMLEHKDRSIATVSVVTEEQIRQMGARNLTDVLYTVPGINITQSSWGQKQITLRGITTLASEKVLVLLNGHPLDHDITNGGGQDVYDKLALDNVKRIEVVRGPGSLLYGANAFLGTINVITKNSDDQKGVQATANGGSYGSQQYNLYAANQYDDLKVTANANIQSTDGIKAKLGDTDLTSNLAGHDYDFDLNLRYKEWRFNGHFADNQTGSFASFYDFQPQTVGYTQTKLNANNRHNQDYFFILGYNTAITDSLKVDLKGYHNNFNFANKINFCQQQPTINCNDGYVDYHNNGITNTKSGGEAQFDYQWFDKNNLIIGFKGETQDQFDVKDLFGTTSTQLSPSSSPFAINQHRTLASGFVQDVWDILPNLKLSAGARYDHYSDFGNAYNPRVGFNWEFTEGYIFRYEYGTSFRAPTFGETNGGNPIFGGNKSLQPETVSTNEVGLTVSPFKNFNASLTLYNSEINNLITFNSANNMFMNQGNDLSRGAEFESKYTYMEGSYLSVNYTAQKVTDTHTNQMVWGVPSHFGNVMLNHQFNSNYNLLTHVFVKGEQLPFSPATIGVPAYALLNSTLQAKNLIKNTTFSASVYNWLDKSYQDPAQYLNGNFPTPGRSVYIRADFKF